MNVAIVGSRGYPHRKDVREWIVSRLTRDDVVISGGARGVDSWANDIAKSLYIKSRVFPAEWEKFGRSAGYLRNADIVDAADLVVAFWDGQSRGTKHTIDLALQKRKRLEVIFPE